MFTANRVEIAAPTPVVWAVYADLERWPDWTASVTKVVPLDGSELAVGHRFRITQPRFPTLDWEVSEVEPGTGWTWIQRSPGGTTIAVHAVAPDGPGRTVARQSIDQRGPVGTLVGVLARRITRRYLDMEGQGLKAASESRHRHDAAAS